MVSGGQAASFVPAAHLDVNAVESVLLHTFLAASQPAAV